MSPGVPCCGSAPVCGLPSSHVTLFSLVHLQSTKSCSLQCCHMQLFFFPQKLFPVCLASLNQTASSLKRQGIHLLIVLNLSITTLGLSPLQTSLDFLLIDRCKDNLEVE